MARSATDIVQEIINAAVTDAIVALKDASRGLPNALLRDLNAIHANTAFADLPPSVRGAIAVSVRDAFTRLQKDGYVIAEAKRIIIPDGRVPAQRPNVAKGLQGPAQGKPKDPRRPPPRPPPGPKRRGAPRKPAPGSKD